MRSKLNLLRPKLTPRVGLALGGGAARGLAHIGVIRALEREGIEVDMITGTSMGSIVGGAWAATGDIDAIEAKTRAVLSSEEFKKNRLSFLRETRKQRGGLFFSVANLVRRGIFFGMSNMRPSFLSAEEFARSIEQIVPDVLIESSKKPFAAIALDINKAREIVLTKGSLRRAAAASSAIPGVLPPVPINGRVLIDGGWVDKIPVLPAFGLGADMVIAVDITASIQDETSYDRGLDIMVRANAIRDMALVRFCRSMADILIRPPVQDVHWADFGAYDRCIKAGEAETMAMMPQIKEKLRHARLLHLVRPSVGKRLADLYLQADDRAFTVE
jgi:NTE family protein